MNIQDYLKRIGFEGKPRVDVETLRVLHKRHLMTVPYENLDIMRNVPLSLELNDIYEKIVVRGRGGYCFELNALFTRLLREIGFDVEVYFGRFLRDEPPEAVPMRRHRVMGVRCDGGLYLCDVGVGGRIPREPIPVVADALNEQYGETYKLVKDDFFGYVLTELHKGEWRRIYAFTMEPQTDIDFVAVSYYCEVHPESFFRTMDMVHLFTEDGRKSVAGREFRVFSGEGVAVEVPGDEDGYERLLARAFGIVL